MKINKTIEDYGKVVYEGPLIKKKKKKEEFQKSKLGDRIEEVKIFGGVDKKNTFKVTKTCIFQQFFRPNISFLKSHKLSPIIQTIILF